MPSLRLSSILLLAFAAPLVAQQAPIHPMSAYESDVDKAAASLAASTKDSPADLITTGEKTGWKKTGLYAETVTIMRRMEKLSPYVKVEQIGTTPEGRPMYVMVVSSDKAFTPEAARKTDKAVILIQSGIHSGEIEGKDTALMLVRDMVITKHPHQAAWLKSAIFVVMPVFNVDGHENRSPFNRANQNDPDITGTRAQSQGLNLNRDYIRAATPEMQAWLKMYHAWMPEFMFDNHVTDGADYQYDVTWDVAHHGDMGEPTRQWVNDRYIPELNKRMEKDGHLTSPYGALRRAGAPAGQRGGGGGQADAPGAQREFYIEVFSPRYSHIYAGFLNRPCLLVESHSLKSGKSRAWSHYDIMTNSIDIVTEDPQALRKAVRDADAKYAAMAGDHNGPAVYLSGKTSTESHPIMYHSLKTAPYSSEISGTMVTSYTGEKDDFEVAFHDDVDTVTDAQMPLGWLIPPGFKEFADELALHGVQMERTTKPISQEFDTWRFSNVKYAPAMGEGGQMTYYDFKPVKEKVDFPVGSYYVPMKQTRARLILALLHPAAPDALIRWNVGGSFFGTMGRVGAGAYVAVPIANKVADEHPEWMTEFQAKVKSDPKFAADSQARIDWWVSRSNYQPSAVNRYPIVEVWEKSW